MGNRLATIDMGQKLVDVPLLWGSWISIQHNVAWGEAYLRTKWHLDPSSPLVTINMGQKVGAASAPFGEGIWVPI